TRRAIAPGHHDLEHVLQAAIDDRADQRGRTAGRDRGRDLGGGQCRRVVGDLQLRRRRGAGGPVRVEDVDHDRVQVQGGGGGVVAERAGWDEAGDPARRQRGRLRRAVTPADRDGVRVQRTRVREAAGERDGVPFVDQGG